MAERIGVATTVEELIEILQQQPSDLPVRTRSLTHEWPVTVHRHQLCLTLEID